MHEIINVVDPESHAVKVQQSLEIEAVNDHSLAIGYYFVLWPTKTRLSRNWGKRYFGPFATRAEARLLQTSALALCLVQNEEAIQTIAECRSIVRRPVASSNAPGSPRDSSPWFQQTAVCAA
jgi:hypothetical protein